MSRVFLALTSVIALLAIAVQPVAATEFSECFCWDNANQNFCGGERWWKTHACNQWFLEAFGFTIPAIIGIFVLLIFPCLFYCSRILCNCCGGRHRTYGLCCADNESRHRFPGYSNRAIFIAKVMMCSVFAAYIYYAVGGYTTNAKLHTDVLGTLDDLDNTLNNLESNFKTGAGHLTTLADFNFNPPLVAKSFAQEISSTSATLQGRLNQIHTVLDDIRKVENNQQWGRAESVYRYPSCVLMVLLITVVLMALNLRKAMGPMMVLLCLTTCVEAVVFIPHMVMAQGVTAICDNYNDTFVPVVIGAVQSGNGCNNSDLTNGLNELSYVVRGQLWNDASSLCASMDAVCEAMGCEYTTCNPKYGQIQTFELPELNRPFNIEGFAVVVNQQFKNPQNGINTFADCATKCTDANVKSSAQAIVNFYNSAYPSLEFLLVTAYSDNYNCSAVRAPLQGVLHTDLCVDINRRITNTAMVLGVMYLLSFLTLPVIIRGMKRFMPFKRGQTIGEVARETVYSLDAQVNALPVDGEVAGYTALDAGDDANALHAADSAYYRRFVGLEKHHTTADQPNPNTLNEEQPLMQQQV